MTIGQDATGNLTVYDAAVLDSQNGTIGQNAGSTGSILVSDANSHWVIQDSLVIGAFGSGTMTIQAGARVTDASASIGNAGAGLGNVTVDGVNSTWENDGNLFVGGAQGPGGSGFLVISNGGAVDSIGADIGLNQGSFGRITVTGAGSMFNAGANAPLIVGGDGDANLTSSKVARRWPKTSMSARCPRAPQTSIPDQAPSG